MIHGRQIHTFAPEPYRVLRPIPVVVRTSGDQYVAAFHEANIHASGDTDQEAYENLKGMILDTLELLNEHADALGVGPTQQLAVLREFICDPSPEATANR